MATSLRDRPGKGIETMKWLKTLNNPFALVAQGFAAGAILFFATSDSAANVEAVVRGFVS